MEMQPGIAMFVKMLLCQAGSVFLTLALFYKTALCVCLDSNGSVVRSETIGTQSKGSLLSLSETSSK